MSGLMFAGMALGGIHIANAQNNVNPEIDNSRYTVMIPSEVNIDKNTGKGSFAVTGKVKAQSTIDVSIQSKNGYKLKDKNGELPYNIDKKSFSIDNSRSASDIPLNEEFNIASKTNTKVSGYYTDSLTFDITSESYKYRLDVNGNLDDNGIGDGRLDDFGRFDVYLNGKLVKENVEDFCEPIPYGTTWEIKNIRSLDGYRYKDSSDIRTKGVAGDVVEWEGDLLGDTSIYRITYVNLKFYSNKLTINYHADGAQTWKTANINNASEIDVTGKDIIETEALKYDELYGEDAGYQHFCSASRIKRDGYTAKANTWKVGQKDSLEVLDYKTLQKAQDVAEYCGVLDSFKKNDITIDLYPIWIPNTYTLTFDLNGGSFNASTTQLFKYGSGDAISSEIPIKTGYDFVGWKWGDVTMQPGDKINKGWGNFTLTAQWLKVYPTGTVLNIDGSDYIVLSQTDDGKYLVIRKDSIGNRAFQSKTRDNGIDIRTYEGSEIDNYLENDWYNNLSPTMKNAIQMTDINQIGYYDIMNVGKYSSLISQASVPDPTSSDPDQSTDALKYTYIKKEDKIYNKISRHVYLPSIADIGNVVELNNLTSIRKFLNGTSFWTRDHSKPTPISNNVYALNADSMNIMMLENTQTMTLTGVRPAFVIDLSKVDYTVTGTVNYK